MKDKGFLLQLEKQKKKEKLEEDFEKVFM